MKIWKDEKRKVLSATLCSPFIGADKTAANATSMLISLAAAIIQSLKLQILAVIFFFLLSDGFKAAFLMNPSLSRFYLFLKPKDVHQLPID